jgi:hypothetical protein
MRSADIFGFYFSGHNSIEGRLEHLKATANLGNVTHILLSGQSAGGIGVYNNADYIKNKFPGVYFKGSFPFLSFLPPIFRTHRP